MMDRRAASGPALTEDHLVRRPVPPALRGLVADIAHYRETVTGRLRQVETAALVVPLVIVLGDRFGIGLGREPSPRETYASFTSGLFAGPVVIHSTGVMECVQVNFTPLGALRFFGLPMSDLSGRMVDIRDLADPDLPRLGERLADLRDVSLRLETVLNVVSDRLARRDGAGGIAAQAYRLMLDRGGDLRIGSLARHLDVSRKHLAEQFRAAVGLPPKAVARIMRFNRAQALARGGGDWAAIAAACGYSDQAHLAREFLDLSGSTPTGWRAAA